MKKYIVIISLLLLFAVVFADIPVNIKPILTSSFGEYRPNHIHSGVDFSTYAMAKPLLAIDDGYLYMLIVNKDDLYGNQVYVYHPKLKLFSEIAHLSRFSDKFSKLISIAQQDLGKKDGIVLKYDIKNIDNSIPLKKGDVLGYAGSTGTVEATHCHFEIHDNSFQYYLNPLSYLSKFLPASLKESYKPIIKAIRIKSNNTKTSFIGNDWAFENEIPADLINGKTLYVKGNFSDLKFDINAVDCYMRDSKPIYKLGIYSLKVEAIHGDTDEIVYDEQFDKLKHDEFDKSSEIYAEGTKVFGNLEFWYRTYIVGYKLTPVIIAKKLPDLNSLKIKITVSNYFGAKKYITFYLKKY
jgi:hypothetical protein